MQLYLDFGNSRVKWALAEKSADIGIWYSSGAWSYDDSTPDLFGQLSSLKPIQSTYEIWYASVVSQDIVKSYLLHLEIALSKASPIHQAEVHAHSRLQNAYDSPEKLGIDRWLAALAAHYYYPDTNLIIANMGTATTIDVVKAEGIFTGGWIIPGLLTMLKSLGGATWQLPKLDQLPAHNTPNTALACSTPQFQQSISTRPLLPASNTVEGMQNGCLAAQIGAINYLYTQLSTPPLPTPICVLTGGASTAIQALLPLPSYQIDNLVLHGLQRYAQDMCQ